MQGGGKGYVLKTVSYGQAPPQDPTTYLLYTIFGRKSTPPPAPFAHLLLTNLSPITYLV